MALTSFWGHLASPDIQADSTSRILGILSMGILVPIILVEVNITAFIIAGSPHTESSSKRQSKCQQVTLADNNSKNVVNINCHAVFKYADDILIREELVGKLEELRGLSFLICTEVPL